MNLNEDTEFRNVINTLKQLQQIKAPANFEADLMRRINSEGVSGKQSFWQTIFIPSRMVPAAALVITTILLIFVINNSGAQPEDPFSYVPRERNDIIAASEVINYSPAETKKDEKVLPRTEEMKEVRNLPSVVSEKSKVQSLSLKEAETNKLESITPQERAGIQKDEGMSADKLEAVKPAEEVAKPSVIGNIAVQKQNKYLDTSHIAYKKTSFQVNKAGLNFRHVKISSEQKNELNQLRQKLFGK